MRLLLYPFFIIFLGVFFKNETYAVDLSKLANELTTGLRGEPQGLSDEHKNKITNLEAQFESLKQRVNSDGPKSSAGSFEIDDLKKQIQKIQDDNTTLKKEMAEMKAQAIKPQEKPAATPVVVASPSIVSPPPVQVVSPPTATPETTPDSFESSSENGAGDMTGPEEATPSKTPTPNAPPPPVPPVVEEEPIEEVPAAPPPVEIIPATPLPNPPVAIAPPPVKKKKAATNPFGKKSSSAVKPVKAKPVVKTPLKKRNNPFSKGNAPKMNASKGNTPKGRSTKKPVVQDVFSGI
jgi:hypothetical protein